jgi:flagellin
MSLRVNTNIAAMNAYRNLTVTEGQMGKSLEKLSSGFRINRAADDAAGLVNSESLRSQVGGLKVATRNAQDGISVAQTAEGALNEVHSILQRMRDLSVQRANAGGNSTTSNTAIDNEYAALASEVARIGTSTEFNGNKLLDGSYTAVTGTFQVGANATDTVSLDLSTVNLSTVSTALGATATSIAAVDAQIAVVSGARGTMGAFQNRLEHTIANLGVAVENLSASESRIRDTDMAQEMTAFSRSQIGGLKVASRNAQDGISVAQTAEGALTEVHAILQRMRDLSVQRANAGGNSTTANTAIDSEYAALASEVDRIGTSTEFNGNKLLDGSYTAAVGTFQVGANATDTVSLDLSAVDLNAVSTALGTTATSIAGVDAQIAVVSGARGTMGAFQNRLEHTVANLGVAVENLSASESRIRDTDMAQEMTTFSRNQIMNQAGTAMLAQANQASQGVLSLLKG